MGTFKKGLFFGGLVGAGIMWLATTKKGKEVREKMIDHASVAYEKLKAHLKASQAWKKMNKNTYVQMAREIVDTYALEAGLGPEVKNAVMRFLKTQLPRIKRELLKES